MKKLPHQKERNEYYEEKKTNDKAWKNWEVRLKGGGDIWIGLVTDPQFNEMNEYRRKPQFININGFEVPEPYRGEMKSGQTYYEAIGSSVDFCSAYKWAGTDLDMTAMERGFIHLNKESAAIHGKAIASFTKQ